MSTDEIDQTSTAPSRKGGKFEKGCSGNKKGRPRKADSELGDHVRKAMADKVEVVQNGKRRKMSKGEVASSQLANKSAAGDLAALRLAASLVGQSPSASGDSAAPHHRAQDEEIVVRLAARLLAMAQAGAS